MKIHKADLIKLNFKEMEKMLTPYEMKKILAGIADCQVYNEYCSNEESINCCSGLTCVDSKCVLKSNQNAAQ